MLKLKDINPKNILVINTFGIGDVLFTNPFVRSLKANFPDARISYLANQRAFSILQGFGVIDETFIYERDEYYDEYKRSKLAFWKKASAFLKELEQKKFDVVFDFSLNSTINALTWKVGIPHRIGFNYRNRGRFLTHKVDFKGFDRIHVVEHYLKLLRDIGLHVADEQMRIHLAHEDEAWASQFFKDNGLTHGEKPIIGILPGAGASWGKEARYRRWDKEKYTKLVDKIVEKYDAQIILMGDKSEEDVCDHISSHSSGKVVSAVGKTSITQLAALMAACSLVVLNDGGPLHVGVAAGAKTVSIFGPVDENIYGPYAHDNSHLVVTSDIVCRPCYRRFRMTKCSHVSCLNWIQIDDVLRKVGELL